MATNCKQIKEDDGYSTTFVRECGHGFVINTEAHQYLRRTNTVAYQRVIGGALARVSDVCMKCGKAN